MQLKVNREELNNKVAKLFPLTIDLHLALDEELKQEKSYISFLLGWFLGQFFEGKENVEKVLKTRPKEAKNGLLRALNKYVMYKLAKSESLNETECRAIVNALYITRKDELYEKAFELEKRDLLDLKEIFEMPFSL